MSLLAKIWLFGLALVLLFFCVLCVTFARTRERHTQDLVNPAPVVGILTQELLNNYKNYQHNRSYIPSQYIKLVEAGGGIPLPILVNQPDEYYREVLSQVNCVLLPGGNQDIERSSWADAAQKIFDHSISSTDGGNYFPLWGTCQGFQSLAYHTEGKNLLIKNNVSDIPMPIGFTMSLEDMHVESKLFKELEPRLYKEMKELKVAMHYHNFSLTREKISQSTHLESFYRILAEDRDPQGKPFVSIIEAKKYPIYGVIFHPEIPPYNFFHVPGHDQIPHTIESIRTSQYFTNFFINECRKNGNRLSSQEKNLFRHTNPEDISRDNNGSGLTYYQVYFFPLK